MPLTRKCGMEGGVGRLMRGTGPGTGFFLVHLFHRQKSQRKNSTGQSTRTRPARGREKKTGLEQTANDSDVWFTLLFTSFAVACPFSTQHSALSCLHSLAQRSRVHPGPSCAGPRPPLQALYVCVCVWVGGCAQS